MVQGGWAMLLLRNLLWLLLEWGAGVGGADAAPAAAAAAAAAASAAAAPDAALAVLRVARQLRQPRHALGCPPGHEPPPLTPQLLLLPSTAAATTAAVGAGGDPTGTGEGGESIYGQPFRDEVHSRLRFNHRGLVACANQVCCCEPGCRARGWVAGWVGGWVGVPDGPTAGVPRSWVGSWGPLERRRTGEAWRAPHRHARPACPRLWASALAAVPPPPGLHPPPAETLCVPGLPSLGAALAATHELPSPLHHSLPPHACRTAPTPTAASSSSHWTRRATATSSTRSLARSRVRRGGGGKGGCRVVAKHSAGGDLW